MNDWDKWPVQHRQRPPIHLMHVDVYNWVLTSYIIWNSTLTYFSFPTWSVPTRRYWKMLLTALYPHITRQSETSKINHVVNTTRRVQIMNVGFMQLSLSLSLFITFRSTNSLLKALLWKTVNLLSFFVKAEGQVLHLYNTVQTYSKETTLYGLPLYAFFAVLPFLLFF